MCEPKNHTYTVDFDDFDYEGKRCGHRTFTGTMSEVCRELVPPIVRSRFNIDFNVTRNGDFADSEDFFLRHWATMRDGFTFCTIDPSEKVLTLPVHGCEEAWRADFCHTLDKVFHKFDVELYGCYF